MRGVKNARSMRDDYAAEAVGYVQLQRSGGLCTVKARVTPEHRIHATGYQVVATIKESPRGNEILSCQCLDCAASQGGCKHNLALLAWLVKSSMAPSVTSVECYWKKSSLASAIQYGTCVLARDIGNSEIEPVKKSDFNFLDFYLEGGVEEGMLHHTMNPPQRFVSLHEASVLFHEDNGPKTATDFINFLARNITSKQISEMEKQTRGQSTNNLWYELRFGRITGSTIYQLAHSKEEDGTIVQMVLGGYSIPDSEAMKRGRRLEDAVISKMIPKCGKGGFFIDDVSPIFGASPDGITDDLVVEVKCPSKASSMKNFITQAGRPTSKVLAQVQLQMHVCKRRKALLGVASPNFEVDNEVTVIEIQYEEEYCQDLMRQAQVFWEKAIFSKLMKSCENIQVSTSS
ncbi:hypothetical protein GE061_019957 [Apolygus lucorum]|uniref:YqaJ viral recombinase domain-containing protein n=1 Tax=Apolygus lucorum TaxID=248454 RepID=A0A8S9XA09_APOLU|nr:hypothetical protein GE061_019956 [Apolygus lucorum]KAF6205783.1 hypothetical protein GE061_019957 [Apolygus lucorum]